jgi:retinol-binding protein 3
VKKILSAVGFVCFIGVTAISSFQKAAAPPLSPDAIRQTIETAAKLIAENYVLSEKGKEIAGYLLARLKEGQYAAAKDPDILAGLVTRDLLAVGNDLHLGLTTEKGGFGPQPRAAAPGVPAGPVQPSLQPNGFGPHYNFGFLKLDRLAGNIGYLQLALFNDLREEGAQRAVEAAMNFLSGLDAVIIDIRYNGGGSGQMADRIASHFFGPQPVHLLSNTMRQGGREVTMESWTLKDIPGRRMSDKDLYVLISHLTGSAAEHFAFGLKGQRRAVLVGETTAGAGFNVAFIPIDDRFTLKVSIGRTYDPRTNQGWEKVGVAPDIEAPEEKALDIAHLLALQGLADKIKDENHKKEILWLKDLVQRRANPLPFDAGTFSIYAGSYGPNQILNESGHLSLVRAGRRFGARLIPLSGSVFSVVGDDTRLLEFESKNAAIELIVRYLDGRVLRFPKDAPAR